MKKLCEYCYQEYQEIDVYHSCVYPDLEKCTISPELKEHYIKKLKRIVDLPYVIGDWEVTTLFDIFYFPK